jgi:hypothetical protein
MDKNKAGFYHRTTTYLTDEQWRWLGRLAAQARLDDRPLSASDVIRLAEGRLDGQISAKDLREAKRYPRRARRGPPEATRTSCELA